MNLETMVYTPGGGGEGLTVVRYVGILFSTKQKKERTWIGLVDE